MRLIRGGTRWPKAVLGILAGIVLTIGAAGTASAVTLHTYSSTYNASEAWSYNQDPCNGNSAIYHNPRVSVKDTWADGYDVYVEHYRADTGGGMQTLWNTGGSGTTEHSVCDGSNHVNRIRGCTSRPVIPDVCAAWDE